MIQYTFYYSKYFASRGGMCGSSVESTSTMRCVLHNGAIIAGEQYVLCIRPISN